MKQSAAPGDAGQLQAALRCPLQDLPFILLQISFFLSEGSHVTLWLI